MFCHAGSAGCALNLSGLQSSSSGGEHDSTCLGWLDHQQGLFGGAGGGPRLNSLPLLAS